MNRNRTRRLWAGIQHAQYTPSRRWLYSPYWFLEAALLDGDPVPDRITPDGMRRLDDDQIMTVVTRFAQHPDPAGYAEPGEVAHGDGTTSAAMLVGDRYLLLRQPVNPSWFNGLDEYAAGLTRRVHYRRGTVSWWARQSHPSAVLLGIRAQPVIPGRYPHLAMSPK